MRLFKHILMLLLVVLPIQLLGMVILLLVLPFVPTDREILPKMFRWFDNAEIPLGIGSKDDGLAGPAYYRGPYLFSLRKLPYPIALFIVRYTWLALRNPINYFQHKVVGVHITHLFTANLSKYDEGVGNKEGDHEGTSYLEINMDNKTIWELYIVKKYKWLPNKCFRLRIGWALDKPSECTIGSYKRWVFTITPFMSYEGT